MSSPTAPAFRCGECKHCLNPRWKKRCLNDTEGGGRDEVTSCYVPEEVSGLSQHGNTPTPDSPGQGAAAAAELTAPDIPRLLWSVPASEHGHAGPQGGGCLK